MNDDVTIRLSNVAKAFGETRALKRCDFEAKAGEVHAIVGENGSGKSTMAKIISGVLLPDGGSVEIMGTTVRSPLDAKRIGLATIFQEVLVADEASVLDNLFVGGDNIFQAVGNTRDRRSNAAALLSRLVGREVDLDSQVGSLPLSVKQWVVIARAVLRRPRILILDESSAALDLDSTVRLPGEIDRLRSEGATILIVTHRIAELVRIADRATILRDGVTVGVLQKAEITEASLLEMMTPPDRKMGHVADYASTGNRSNSQAALTVSDLKLHARGEAFNFFLPRGAIVGIAGLDGQGQDAFLRAIAGILQPFGGNIQVTDPVSSRKTSVSTLADATKAKIAYVSGDRKREGIFPQLSIFENLAIGVYKGNIGPLGIISRSKVAPKFKQEVARLKIKFGAAGDLITSLSGGNQQKILIGRAFANEPDIIVLNDPARGVDLGTKRDLYRELREFTNRGGSVVYLSSEIEEFLGFADRVDVFHGGRVFRSLSVKEIAEKPILAAMFGQSSSNIVAFDVARAAS